MAKPWEKLKQAFEQRRKERAQVREFTEYSRVRTPVWLIAGLGNFGPEYEATRHNCGFRTIDSLCQKLDVSAEKHQFKGVCREAMYGGAKLVLLKPYTYMNNSGESIREALDWYKIPENRLIVIYDDCDLALGAIRIRQKGSAGNHNGMKSVLQHTDTEEFPRIRIGIGARPAGYDMVGFVLGRFSDSEEPVMRQTFDTAAEAALFLIINGAEQAMSRFNTPGVPARPAAGAKHTSEAEAPAAEAKPAAELKPGEQEDGGSETR